MLSSEACTPYIELNEIEDGEKANKQEETGKVEEKKTCLNPLSHLWSLSPVQLKASREAFVKMNSSPLTRLYK